MGGAGCSRDVVCSVVLIISILLKFHFTVANDEIPGLKEHAEHFYGSNQDGDCQESEGRNGISDRSDTLEKEEEVQPAAPVAVKLTRLDGVQVGHVQEVNLTPGRSHYLHTINMKPLIFEIPDFFSEEECQHIIELAMKQGLEVSSTHQITADNTLRLLDTNGDQRLSLQEMRRTIEDGYDIFFNDEDIREMYSHLKLDLNQDDFISRSESSGLNVHQLAAYIKTFVSKNPIKKSRYSEQTWIYPERTKDDLVAEFQRRLLRLTRLPEQLINKYSFFQVVKYGRHGHYNAHLDSAGDTQGLPCCHLVSTKKCRICRYMTIMVYLNDVEEGGETAFVVANNDTFDDHKLRNSGNINLNNHCKESKLHVRPERGKAVIWYNHFLNEETGWFGDVDNFTWHGGCPVMKGEKWIMNRWICASNDREVDLS
nr:transmembrane prolyl 4-hydroxylase-like [Lytechinus pictus]